MSEPAEFADDAAGGCGPALAVLLTFVTFSIVTAWIGIATTNFALYFAGLPVSGFFALFGSELILAWPLDALVWISTAWMVGQRVPPSRYVRFVLIVLGVAIAYGYTLSQFVEPTGSIL